MVQHLKISISLLFLIIYFIFFFKLKIKKIFLDLIYDYKFFLRF
jgi:hypothetical protein